MTDIMYSREASWGWIISAPLIDLHLSLQVDSFVKLMGLHGWHFIVSICTLCIPYFVAALNPLSRLSIALELAKHNAVYEGIASKFFEVGLSYILFYQ